MSKRKASEEAGEEVASDKYTFDDSAVDKVAVQRAGVKPLETSAFSFFIISKGRPANVSRMEALFEGSGATPTWLVGAGEVNAYKLAGASAVLEGGKLCPSRNLALDTAASQDKVCVQLSDDLQRLEYMTHDADGGFVASGSSGSSKKGVASAAAAMEKSPTEWKKPPTQQESNARSYAALLHPLSPVGAAKLCEAFMRGPTFSHTDEAEKQMAAAATAASTFSPPPPPPPSSSTAKAAAAAAAAGAGAAGAGAAVSLPAEAAAPTPALLAPPSLCPRRPRFAGAYPCMNAGFAFNAPPLQTQHFVVGDFIVVDVRKSAQLVQDGDDAPYTSNSSKDKKSKGGNIGAGEGGSVAAAAGAAVAAGAAGAGNGGNGGSGECGGRAKRGYLRFDERMLLKEDYDFTCQHLETYGAVCRLNRLFVKAEHRDNAGGAVDDRNSNKEKAMINILQRKWPGVFKGHRRALEVSMWWKCWQPFYGARVARRFQAPPPLPEGAEGAAAESGGAAAALGGVGGVAGGGEVFHGKVVKFMKPREDDEEELWNVEYEDGDAEDLDRFELAESMALHKELAVTSSGGLKKEKKNKC